MRLVSLCSLALFCSCGQQRLAELEKENRELHEKLSAQNLDLQAKCATDAEAYFVHNWKGDSNTLLLEYSNHYSQKLNRCYITVEYNFKAYDGNPDSTVTVADVYSGFNVVATFNDHTPAFSSETNKFPNVDCRVGAVKCQTREEFEMAIKPYRED